MEPDFSERIRKALQSNTENEENILIRKSYQMWAMLQLNEVQRMLFAEEFT